MRERKDLRPVWSQRRAAGVLTGAALLLVLVLGGVFLRSGEGGATAAQKRMFVPARVTDVLTDDARAEPWSEGLRLGAQTLEVELLRGPHRGTVLETVHYLSAYSNIDCRVGTRIIVRLDYDDGGEPYILSVPAYDRGPVLAGALLVFALLLIALGGRKGVMALLGLGYTLAGIWFLLLLTGFTRKTLCAGLGCICGVAAAGLFVWIVGQITPISGFNMSEAEDLVLRSGDSLSAACSLPPWGR